MGLLLVEQLSSFYIRALPKITDPNRNLKTHEKDPHFMETATEFWRAEVESIASGRCFGRHSVCTPETSWNFYKLLYRL